MLVRRNAKSSIPTSWTAATAGTGTQFSNPACSSGSPRSGGGPPAGLPDGRPGTPRCPSASVAGTGLFAIMQRLTDDGGIPSPSAAGRARYRRRDGRAWSTGTLRGLLRCGDCGRRMQGNWNNGRPHYRCRYPGEYARAKALTHPPTVLRPGGPHPARRRRVAVRSVRPRPPHRDRDRPGARPTDHDGPAVGLRRRIAGGDCELARHRAVLEAGADRVMISEWTRQVQIEQHALRAQLEALGACRAAAMPSRSRCVPAAGRPTTGERWAGSSTSASRQRLCGSARPGSRPRHRLGRRRGQRDAKGLPDGRDHHGPDLWLRALAIPGIVAARTRYPRELRRARGKRLRLTTARWAARGSRRCSAGGSGGAA